MKNNKSQEQSMFKAMDAANRASSRRESLRAVAIVGGGLVALVVVLAIAVAANRYM